MTTVDVLVPWRDEGCVFRQKALRWVIGQYADHHPTWPGHVGSCAPGPFNRSAAILDAARQSSADVLVITDADVYCDPRSAVAAAENAGWAIPHQLVHRLSPESTEQVLGGAPWQGLPLSTDNSFDRRPYKGHETGTLFVIRREVLLDVPPDVRFVGWGQEDDAHASALRTLVGAPWRGDHDLVHLWHPAQPRKTRRVGNDESLKLEMRYRKARGKPTEMRALVDESRKVSA